MAAIFGHVLHCEYKSRKYSLPGKSMAFGESFRASHNNTLPRAGSLRRASFTAASTTSMVSHASSSHESKSWFFAKQATFYVGTFYLTYLFGSWTRISQMASGTAPFPVIALFAIFFPLQGYVLK